MLLNHLLFWMMMLEGAVCLLVSLPVGQSAKQGVVRFLSARLRGSAYSESFSTAATVLVCIVGLLFTSDVATCYKHHSSDEALTDGLRIRLLTAQRDMYITGFCLFLFMLLRLVYHALETNLRLERSLDAMKKQAEGVSTGYQTLLTENETTAKQLAKLQSLMGEDKDEDSGLKKPKDKKDVLATLLDENAALTSKLEMVTKELSQASAAVDVVKKQADGQSAAYMKLMDEKAAAESQAQRVAQLETELETLRGELTALTTERDSLKSQVQDYDFMFADAKKKAL